MRRPSVFEGVWVAAIISAIGAAFLSVYPYAMYLSDPEQLVFTALAGFYIFYLLFRSEEKTGRITIALIWIVVSLVCLFVIGNTLFLLVSQLGMSWLVRLLYYHNGVLTAFADFILICLGVLFAAWASNETYSTFLTLWCFFLVQSLFVLIPANISIKGNSRQHNIDTSDRFAHAHQVAEMAVRKLTRIQ